MIHKLIHLKKHPTVHNMILSAGGLCFMLLGFAYFNLKLDTDFYRHTGAIGLVGGDNKVWGVVWMAAGVFALLASRTKLLCECGGYMALTALASFWGAVYAFGVMFDEAPPTRALDAIVWSMVAFLWWYAGVHAAAQPRRRQNGSR